MEYLCSLEFLEQHFHPDLFLEPTLPVQQIRGSTNPVLKESLLDYLSLPVNKGCKYPSLEFHCSISRIFQNKGSLRHRTHQLLGHLFVLPSLLNLEFRSLRWVPEGLYLLSILFIPHQGCLTRYH